MRGGWRPLCGARSPGTACRCVARTRAIWPTRASSPVRRAGAGETVVALSGDGMVGAVADVLRHVPDSLLGVLPGGRGNDFARVLGIPADPVAACAVIADGVPRAMDLGEVEGRMPSWASPARASTATPIASPTRRRRGWATSCMPMARCARCSPGALRASRSSLSPRTARAAGRRQADRRRAANPRAPTDRRRASRPRRDRGRPAPPGGPSAATRSPPPTPACTAAGCAWPRRRAWTMACSTSSRSSDVSKLRFLANLPKVFKGTHVRLPSVKVLRAAEVNDLGGPALHPVRRRRPDRRTSRARARAARRRAGARARRRARLGDPPSPGDASSPGDTPSPGDGQ